MASLKAIRKRISSVRNTQQITKAMKMVAAAKLRRAQERVIGARPYASLLGKVLANVREQAHLGPLRVRRDQVRRRPMDVRVEGAAEAAVSRDDHHDDFLFGSHREERVLQLSRLRRDRRQHIREELCVGAGANHAVLGPPELRRRDHLHGLGDLLRALDRAQPAADVDERSHQSIKRPGG